MDTTSSLRFSVIIVTVLFFLAFACYKNPNQQTHLSSILHSQSSIPPHQNPVHPLDPLTVSEINKVHTILSKYPPFSNSFPSIHSLALDEPDKSKVLQWKKGDPRIPRSASVVVILDGQTHILTINLKSENVTCHTADQSSGYPTVTMDDHASAVQTAMTNAELNKSIVARGLKLSDLNCITLTPGWFGSEEEGRRILKLQCYSTVGTPNFYMRPIEGLTVTVDIDKRKVINISDTGKEIPVAKSAGTDYRYTEETRMPEMDRINPISMEQPDGRSFKVDGNIVRWANWEFHVKADQRAGMIISQAKVRDSETGLERSVMYKGFASELFVPYMDLDEGWYYRTYMDAGEFGLGTTSMSLVPLNDCPRNAYYMDGVFVTADGRPYVQPNVICLFERYAGNIAWRHSEIPANGFNIREARPKITLVARTTASVGNYDYIFDWEFQTDGLIRIKAGLSGMLMVKGTTYKHIDEVVKKDEMSGPLVSENLIGVVHDHFITFRLDMDIDGTNNSFVQVNLVKEDASPTGNSPRKSYMKAKRQVAKTENDAKIKLKLYHPSEFQITNPSRVSRLGNPSGYKLVPGATAASLLDLHDPPQMRSAFINNQIWVTPYNRNEQWAGGLLVHQSKGDDTLDVWSSRNREIEKRDVVLWYTMGFHHIPCQEDFPVMPTVSASFDLKPVNFFESNPILGIAPNLQDDLSVCSASASW